MMSQKNCYCALIACFMFVTSLPVNAQVRPNINSFTSSERDELADLIKEYVTTDIIELHACNFTDIHHTSQDETFFYFHRAYIEGLEDFLILKGKSKYVPLPKWDPVDPIPSELQDVDGDCSAADCNNNCSNLEQTDPGLSLPRRFKLPIQSGSNNDLCDFTSVRMFAEDLENWHDDVHVGPSQGGNGVGGNMQSAGSPASVIFWLWHAFVDDVWKEWQCECRNFADVDLYMKIHPNPVPGHRDIGIEPFTRPNNQFPLWESIDIWVRNQADGFTEWQHQNPEYDPNDPVYVYACVRNRGCDATLGTEELHLHWANAEAGGLDWPDRWNGSVTLDDVSNDCSGNTTPVGDLIGTNTVGTIDAGGAKIIETAWNDVPDPEDYICLNHDDHDHRWHYCILGRIVASNDPMNNVTNDIANYVTHNNNVVWKNFSIVDNESGKTSGGECPGLDEIGVIVGVGNSTDEPETYELAFNVPNDEVGTPITQEGKVMVALDDDLYDRWVAGGKQGSGFREVSATESMFEEADVAANLPTVLSENTFEMTGTSAQFENITFLPQEMLTTVLTVLYPSTPVSNKEEFRYRIIQSRANDGKVVGGVTYIMDKPAGTAILAEDQTIDIGCTATLEASPALDCAQYMWFDDNGVLVGTDSSITVRPLETTTYKLRAIASNGVFTEDLATVFVNVGISSLSNMCPEEVREIVNMIPNPAKTTVTVDYIAENTQSAQLRLVKTDFTVDETYNVDAQAGEAELDISDYTAGVYSVILICDGVNEDSEKLLVSE